MRHFRLIPIVLLCFFLVVPIAGFFLLPFPQGQGFLPSEREILMLCITYHGQQTERVMREHYSHDVVYGVPLADANNNGTLEYRDFAALSYRWAKIKISQLL